MITSVMLIVLSCGLIIWERTVIGRSPFYAVSVNCLYRDRVRVSGRDTVRVRVRHPDSSGNLLIRRKMDYAQRN